MTYQNQYLRRFEARLREQASQLEHSMLSVAVQGRETMAPDTLDIVDQAFLSYQKELLFRQGSHRYTQLALVRVALERIDEGAFGECLHCSTIIGAKRLEAIPWATHCIECQEKIEKGEIPDPVRAA